MMMGRRNGLLVVGRKAEAVPSDKLSARRISDGAANAHFPRTLILMPEPYRTRNEKKYKPRRR